MTPLSIIAIPGFSEPFSSLTHLVAAGIFLALGLWLILQSRPSPDRISAMVIFVFCSVFLLSMSGVYHLLEPGGTARIVLQRLDHAGIFLLIAGTFTPIHMILFRGGWRWGMLSLIWILAITGLTLKTIYFNEMPEWVSLTLYLGLGWLGALSATLLYRRHGYHFIKPLLYGALAYSVGAVMEFLRTPILVNGVIGPHEMFHVAVLCGLGFHFFFIHSFARVTTTN